VGWSKTINSRKSIWEREGEYTWRLDLIKAAYARAAWHASAFVDIGLERDAFLTSDF